MKIAMLVSAIYMMVNIMMIALDGCGVFGTLYNAIAYVFGWRPVSTAMAFNEFLLGDIVFFISFMASWSLH
jgi:hypothetical protein